MARSPFGSICQVRYEDPTEIGGRLFSPPLRHRRNVFIYLSRQEHSACVDGGVWRAELEFFDVIGIFFEFNVFIS
jgi:hypothetical protein